MTRSGNASARLRLQLVPSVGEQAFSAGSSAPAGWFCGSTARLAAGSCWFSAVPQRMGAALDPERKDLVRRKKKNNTGGNAALLGAKMLKNLGYSLSPDLIIACGKEPQGGGKTVLRSAPRLPSRPHLLSVHRAVLKVRPKACLEAFLL